MEGADFVLSPLCRKIARNGVTIDVHIYRAVDDQGWLLEVTDPNGGSNVWYEPFSTEEAALSAVMGIIASEGIESFLQDPSKELH